MKLLLIGLFTDFIVFIEKVFLKGDLAFFLIELFLGERELAMETVLKTVKPLIFFLGIL